MAPSRPSGRTATPPQFRIFGVLSLAWNTVAAYDFTMTQIRDPGYVAGFAPETIAWIDTLPASVVVAWAVGVWASLLGSVLLSMRSRRAVVAFKAGLAGIIVVALYQFATGAIAQSLRIPPLTTLVALILAAIVLQWSYAKRQALQGILR